MNLNMVVFIFASIGKKGKKKYFDFIVGSNNSSRNQQQQEEPTSEPVFRHKILHHALMKGSLFLNKEKYRISIFSRDCNSKGILQ